MVTDIIGKAPRRMSKVRVAPSVISTVGVASTVMVKVVPGTTGSSENVTALIPSPSVLPEHCERGGRKGRNEKRVGGEFVKLIQELQLPIVNQGKKGVREVTYDTEGSSLGRSGQKR